MIDFYLLPVGKDKSGPKPNRNPAASEPLASTSGNRNAGAILRFAAIPSLGLLAILGTVFFVELGKTTLKFEIADPNLQVRFGEQAIRISNVARYDGATYDASMPLQPDEHTIVLYRFREGEGDVVKDDSGNGHDGKITGAQWVTVPMEGRTR